MSVSPTNGIGSTQGQRKTLIMVEIEPKTFGFDHHCPLTELQGQTGAGRGNWRCEIHGNEYVQVQGSVKFLQTLVV